LRDILRSDLADRMTDLFGGTELTVPGVLFKTINANALKTGYSERCPSRWLAESHTFLFNKTNNTGT